MTDDPPGVRPPASRRLAFERLAVRRMPGFEEGGFVLDGLSPGVNVIHGPNASGKTTAGRAVRLLLWPRSGEGDASLAAVVDLAGERWEIDLDRDRVRYRRDGAPAEPPALPAADAADRYSLALHELLRPEAQGEDLAAAVAREAAGGYDLEAAREAVDARPKPRNPRKPRAEYEAAVAKVKEEETEQRRIAEEAGDLARLEAELADARKAAARLERVQDALNWVRCRERLARAEEELAGFPAAMERLTGDEAKRLADERERLASAREDRQRVDTDLAKEERRLAEAALPEAGLPPGLLAELGERRERLVALELEMAQRQRGLAEAARRRTEASLELGDDAGDDRLAELRPGDWREVLDLARRSDALRSERLELDALADWIGEARPTLDLERRLDGLGAEARVLRDWLRAPAAGWRSRLPALAAAVALAVLAAAGGFLVHPGLWGLAAVSFLVVLWCWLDVGREARAREGLEAQHRSLPGTEPLPWRRGAVAGRLTELEEAMVAVRGERRRAERRGELDSRAERLKNQDEELEADRRSLVARVGLAPRAEHRGAAPLASLVHSLGRWREANEAMAAGEAAIEEARRQHDRELATLRERLGAYGEAREVVDGASARGAVEALERRSQAHRQATEALERLTADGARADEEIARATGSTRELFARLELEDGDDSALATLLEGLESYEAAVDACRDARTELRLADGKLPAEDELREWGEAALEAERDELEAEAGRLEELVDRLARLRERVAQAKRKQDLEEALARRSETEDALRAEREREADAVTAWVLADWVRERTRGVQSPAVMARAKALFARITGGSFRLLDPVGDPPEFRAEDTRAGATRDLGELSAGRRIQLLVAVRMGFVEEQERGVRVPLVMDETLANSDDASAAALIEAVLELAREGRQVFYLTAQDDEVTKWRAALEASTDGPEWRELDLGAIRQMEAERRVPRRPWRPRLREVPAPGTLGREEYASRLGVPGLDPRGEPGAVHLWHLVEETEPLHELLARGVESWGELEALAADAGSDLLGGGPEGERRRARAAARARCVETLFRAWRKGRGRPVDRVILADSGAVTDRFLDEVSDLAERVEGDPAALLAGLERGEVKGFRSDKTEQLAGYLRDEGYLDDREVLGRAELRELAVTELAAEIEAGDLTLDAIDELLAQMPD